VRHLVLLDITPGVTPDDGGAAVRDFISGQQRFTSVDEIIDRAIAFNIGHDRETLRRGVTLNTRIREDGTLEWTHHLAHLLAQPSEATPGSPFTSGDNRGYESLWADALTIADRGIPITLIRGDTGMVSDELVREWHLHLPASTVHTLNAGHNVQEHNPRELAALLGSIIVA
jgi:pimeloyl-ACP methyl ester carboxylesterase